MTSLSSVAGVLVREHIPPRGDFRSRLAVTSLTTGLDFGVLSVVGRETFHCTSFAWALPAVFSILAVGALVSLSRMWFLTAQSWNYR